VIYFCKQLITRMINRHKTTNTNTTPHIVLHCSLMFFFLSFFFFFLSHSPSSFVTLSSSSFPSLAGDLSLTVVVLRLREGNNPYVVIEQITMGEGPGSESDPNKGEPINFDSDCTDGVKVVQEYIFEG
jgi:hypothetical protein